MPIHVQNQEILFFSSSPPIFLPYSLALTVHFFLSSGKKDEVSLGVLASCTANVTIQNQMEKRRGKKKTGNSLEWVVSLTPLHSLLAFVYFLETSVAFFVFCLEFLILFFFFKFFFRVFNSNR